MTYCVLCFLSTQMAKKTLNKLQKKRGAFGSVYCTKNNTYQHFIIQYWLQLQTDRFLHTEIQTNATNPQRYCCLKSFSRNSRNKKPFMDHHDHASDDTIQLVVCVIICLYMCTYIRVLIRSTTVCS
jgi:hypothetical protein